MTAGVDNGQHRAQFLDGFLLKSSALMLLLASRTYVPYVFARLLMHLFVRVESIHLNYPVEARFRDRYAFQMRALQPVYRWLRWTPCPIGLFWQGGALGLVFAVAADEGTLTDQANTAQLGRLLQRLSRIQRLIGASKVSLAGVLPSHIARNSVDTGQLPIVDPRPATRCALLSAIEQVVAREFKGNRPTILLFGGAGYVGADLAAALQARGEHPIIADIKDPGHSVTDPLSRLQEQPLLIVDVARRNAIAPFVSQFWPGIVLLNETYPEPTGTLLAALKERGVRVHHVAGLNGTLRPALPGAYAGAVPCCAAHRLGDATFAVLAEL